MTKTVDHVEGGIHLPLQSECRHVSHHARRWKSPPLKPLVTELNGMRIQIVSEHLETSFGKLDQQPSRSAGRFEQAAHRSAGILLETEAEKLVLCLPIRPVHQIVILGVIVEMPLDFLDHSSLNRSFTAH